MGEWASQKTLIGGLRASATCCMLPRVCLAHLAIEDWILSIGYWTSAAVLLLSFAPCHLLGGTAEEGDAREFRFAVYGGSEGSGDEVRGVVAQMARRRPELVAHAGGLLSGNSVSDWRTFGEIAEPLLSLCPFYACRSRGQPRPFFQSRNGSPEPPRRGPTYYSLDFRGAHFVFLDTELRADKNDPQTRWIADDLAAAGGKPVFVFTHRAVFGAAERYVMGTADTWWHPIFVRHKVRVVFSGARHLYHRLNQDGVMYVITGGGGGPLDPVMARRQVTAGDVAATFNHFVEVAVSAGEIRCRAIDLEGKTRDEFAVPAAGELPAASR